MFADRSYYTSRDLSINSIFPSLLVDVAESQGANRNELLKAAGIGESNIHSGVSRVSLQEMMVLISHGLEMTGCESLGLEYGKVLDASTNDKLLALLIVCETLEEAVSYSFRYNLGLDIEIDKNNEEFILSCEDQWQIPAPVQRFMLETLAMYWLNVGSMLLRERVIYKRLSFVFPEPKDSQRYFELLGEEITFGAEKNILVFERAQSLQKLPGSNPLLKKALITRYDQELEAYKMEESLPGKVADIITTWTSGSPTACNVAEMLGMPLSSMSKKLHDSGTSFQRILDDIRCKKALKYLRQDQLTVSEIAFNLGYSDPSNFRKAFKNWTGGTPSEFRRQQTGDTSRRNN